MWKGSEEHAELDIAARSLVSVMLNLTSRLRRGDVQHVYHDDSSLRCRSLGILLDSAVANTERHAYGPALTLIRSALEHTFIDKLVFIGQRYVQVFKHVDDHTWAIWEHARKTGEAWTEGIADWVRTKKGLVRITREGIHSKPAEDGSQQTIGIHYFLLSEYSPFVGPPSEQKYFDDGLSDLESRREEAERQRFMYEEHLKWSSVKASLTASPIAKLVDLRSVSGRLS